MTESYTGRRFLLDVKTARQFAVDFKDGKPGPGIEPIGGPFRPGETICAMDDQVEFIVKDGVATVETTLYQISCGRDGRPRNLKLMGVAYDVMLRAGPPHFQLEFQMKDESWKELVRAGFGSDVPRFLTQRADSSSKYFERTPRGYRVQMPFFDNVSLLPQHGIRASSARTGVAFAPGKPLYPDSQLIDEQTLAITKDLGDGKLRTVFNFETQRVTEFFMPSDGRQGSMAGFAFRDYGEEGLQAATLRLKALGGTVPDDGMEKKFSAIKLPPPKP